MELRIFGLSQRIGCWNKRKNKKDKQNSEPIYRKETSFGMWYFQTNIHFEMDDETIGYRKMNKKTNVIEKKTGIWIFLFCLSIDIFLKGSNYYVIALNQKRCHKMRAIKSPQKWKAIVLYSQLQKPKGLL